MTLPYQRYSAINNTRKFLYDLLDPKKTPKVPSSVRQTALRLLKHYPKEFETELISQLAPDYISKVKGKIL